MPTRNWLPREPWNFRIIPKRDPHIVSDFHPLPSKKKENNCLSVRERSVPVMQHLDVSALGQLRSSARTSFALGIGPSRDAAPAKEALWAMRVSCGQAGSWGRSNLQPAPQQQLEKLLSCAWTESDVLNCDVWNCATCNVLHKLENHGKPIHPIQFQGFATCLARVPCKLEQLGQDQWE